MAAMAAAAVRLKPALGKEQAASNPREFSLAQQVCAACTIGASKELLPARRCRSPPPLTAPPNNRSLVVACLQAGPAAANGAVPRDSLLRLVEQYGDKGGAGKQEEQLPGACAMAGRPRGRRHPTTELWPACLPSELSCSPLPSPSNKAEELPFDKLALRLQRGCTHRDAEGAGDCLGFAARDKSGERFPGWAGCRLRI